MRRQARLAAALGAALLLGGAATASTASNSLAVTSNTASYRSVALESSYSVRLQRVRYSIAGSSITGITVDLRGDVSFLGLPRTVRARSGSDPAVRCLGELLTLNDHVRATCTFAVPESATRPRPLTVLVG